MFSRYINAKRSYNKLKQNYLLGGGVENTPICKLEYTGKDPVGTEIIMSVSLFKLNNMYRDITVYVNGLRGIIEYICNPTGKLNIHLIVYHDHSVEQDEKFIDLKKYILANG